MTEESKVVALESDMVPYMKKILKENPDVKLSSYPMATEEGRFLLVKFYLSGEDPWAVKNRLGRVKNDFVRSIREEGFPILE